MTVHHVVRCEPSAASELQPDCCLLMCNCSWCILCWSPWGTQTSSGSSTHSMPSMEATWRSSRASSPRGANRWWINARSTVWFGLSPLWQHSHSLLVALWFIHFLFLYLFIFLLFFDSLILQHMKPNWCRRSSCCVSWRWAKAHRQHVSFGNN